MKNRSWEFAVVLVLVAVGSAYFLREESPEAGPTPALGELAVEARPAENLTPTPQAGLIGLWDAEGVAVWQDFENADGMYGYEEVILIPGFPESSPESVERGRVLYQANCSSCHGEGLKGDGAAQIGANFDPRSTDLTRPGNYKYGRRELGIFRTATYGIEGTGMAPWRGIIAPEDMWDIVHFVRSKQSEQAESSPEENETRAPHQ